MVVALEALETQQECVVPWQTCFYSHGVFEVSLALQFLRYLVVMFSLCFYPNVTAALTIIFKFVLSTICEQLRVG